MCVLKFQIYWYNYVSEDQTQVSPVFPGYYQISSASSNLLGGSYIQQEAIPSGNPIMIQMVKKNKFWNIGENAFFHNVQLILFFTLVKQVRIGYISCICVGFSQVNFHFLNFQFSEGCLPPASMDQVELPHGSHHHIGYPSVMQPASWLPNYFLFPHITRCFSVFLVVRHGNMT